MSEEPEVLDTQETGVSGATAPVEVEPADDAEEIATDEEVVADDEESEA